MITLSRYRLLCCILLLPLIYGLKIVKSEASNIHKKQTLLWTVDWSPDDRWIAVGGDDSLLKIYDGKSLQLVKTFPLKSMIRQVNWHPNKNILAIATHNDSLSILNLDTKKLIKLRGVKYGARGIGWNFNGELLATADNEGLVKIWNQKGNLLKTIKKEDDNSYFSLHWHPYQNTIAVSGDDIRLLDTSGHTLKIIKHRTEQTGVLAVRWHPSGNFFATADYGHDQIESVLQFWKADGTLLKTMHGSKAEYRNIQWNNTGSLLATASDALRIWNNKGTLLFTGRSEDLLWAVDWNNKADRIVTTSINGKIKLWTAQGRFIKQATE